MNKLKYIINNNYKLINKLKNHHKFIILQEMEIKINYKKK
jgi:hypothetical protein